MVAAQPQELFRRRAGELKVAALHERRERRGRRSGQSLKERPAIDAHFRGQSMREVGLINVAPPNVVDDPPHAVAVAFARHRRGDLRHRRLAKRRLGGGRLAKRAELPEPKRGGGLGAFVGAIALFAETGGDQPRLVDFVIEHDEAVVKSNAAFRQLEVVVGRQRQVRLDELFQLVAEVAEAAAEGKRQVDLLEQLVAVGQALEQFPRAAKQRAAAGGRLDFAARAVRLKPQKRPRGDEAEAFAVLHRAGAQQDRSRLGVKPSGERFRRMSRLNFLDQRAGHRRSKFK